MGEEWGGGGVGWGGGGPWVGLPCQARAHDMKQGNCCLDISFLTQKQDITVKVHSSVVQGNPMIQELCKDLAS